MKFDALLIVNDEAAAEVLSRVLEEFQVQSDHCGNADDALQKFDEKRYDAVVVDLSVAAVFDDRESAEAFVKSAPPPR